MLWDAATIGGLAVEGTDGLLGTVSDLLFEEQGWASRWLAVDTGEWLGGRKVLLPHAALGRPDAALRRFPVNLTRSQISSSPHINSTRPVSRQMEAEVYDHYGWDPYWDDDRFETTNGATRLRSIAAVRGYHIHASGGDIGRVEDFLVDDDNWSVRFVAAKVRWWPEQRLLLPPRSALAIDWDNRTLHLNITTCPPSQQKGLVGYTI